MKWRNYTNSALISGAQCPALGINSARSLAARLRVDCSLFGPNWPMQDKCSVPPGIHQVAVEGGQEILQGLGKTLAEFDMSILEETYHLRAPYHPESGLSRVCC